MHELYVVGGQQRGLRSLIGGARDWYEYQRGLILQISPEDGSVQTRVEYVSRSEACADYAPVILFKSASLYDGKLYACTQTEVIVYRLPDFVELSYVSLPCFNDVHHVRPTPSGSLLVASTGLDLVLEVTPQGEVLQEWSTLGEDTWRRFSRATDYRKGISTKPHRSHPNYLFYLDEQPWATRFEQRDAICLNRRERRIPIDVERVHDGVVVGDQIYFTAVHGCIVVVNQHSLKVEELINLAEMHDPNLMLGWCRGILIDGERAWVGFSRLRPTLIRENVSWVKHRFRRFCPTHLACYDLRRKVCLQEIDLEAHGLNAIFSILPAVSTASFTTEAPRHGGHMKASFSSVVNGALAVS